MSTRSEERFGPRGDASTDQSDRSIGELVKQLSEQTRTFVRKEFELARAEMTQKGKVAGIGVRISGRLRTFEHLNVGSKSAPEQPR